MALPVHEQLKKLMAFVSKNKATSLRNALQSMQSDMPDFQVVINQTIPTHKEHQTSLLCVASRKEHIDCMRVLVAFGARLNAGDSQGNTPLMLAVRADNVHAVAWLLKHGADCLVQNRQGETALHWAARGASLKMVETLLRPDFSVDVQDIEGKTPLFHAIWHRNTMYAEKLLQRGAHVNKQTFSGNSMLHWAVYLAAQTGYLTDFAMIELLVRYGANPYLNTLPQLEYNPETDLKQTHVRINSLVKQAKQQHPEETNYLPDFNINKHVTNGNETHQQVFQLMRRILAIVCPYKTRPLSLSSLNIKNKIMLLIGLDVKLGYQVDNFVSQHERNEIDAFIQLLCECLQIREIKPCQVLERSQQNSWENRLCYTFDELLSIIRVPSYEARIDESAQSLRFPYQLCRRLNYFLQHDLSLKTAHASLSVSSHREIVVTVKPRDGMKTPSSVDEIFGLFQRVQQETDVPDTAFAGGEFTLSVYHMAEFILTKVTQESVWQQAILDNLLIELELGKLYEETFDEWLILQKAQYFGINQNTIESLDQATKNRFIEEMKYHDKPVFSYPDPVIDDCYKLLGLPFDSTYIQVMSIKLSGKRPLTLKEEMALKILELYTQGLAYISASEDTVAQSSDDSPAPTSKPPSFFYKREYTQFVDENVILPDYIYIKKQFEASTSDRKYLLLCAQKEMAQSLGVFLSLTTNNSSNPFFHKSCLFSPEIDYQLRVVSDPSTDVADADALYFFTSLQGNWHRKLIKTFEKSTAHFSEGDHSGWQLFRVALKKGDDNFELKLIPASIETLYTYQQWEQFTFSNRIRTRAFIEQRIGTQLVQLCSKAGQLYESPEVDCEIIEVSEIESTYLMH